MNKLSKGLLAFACGYSLYMASTAGIALKQEADKLTELPPVYISTYNHKLIESKDDCNVKGYRTEEECHLMHGLW